jgi:CRISPR system Cascade subunit CasB
MFKHRTHKFITYLESLRDQDSPSNRAAMAQIRRGLGKRLGTPEMYPYVVPWLPLEAPRREQERYFLIASLFAWHPEPATLGQSLGKAFRSMVDKEKSESIEKRFVHLLAADSEDINGRLRQAVSLVRSHHQAIDYHQLFYDIKYWDHQDRFVQLKWARDFWGYLGTNNNQTKGEIK